MLVHAYYESDARVRRYGESLVALGHQVDVLALRAPGTPRRETLGGANLWRLPPSRRRGGVLRYFFEYLSFTLLCFLVLSFRPRRYDVVHVHNMPDFLVFAALVPRLLGRSVVLDVHDLMPEVYCSKFKKSLRHAGIWPFRAQEWLAHHFASAVVFATEPFRGCALARGTVRPEQSIAVLNAPDTRLFDRNLHPWLGPDQPGAFHMLYLGTVSDRHGVDQCVRVLPLVKQRIPGIALVVHPKLSEGEGKPLAALKQLAAELGVADRLHIRPPMQLHEVPATMSRASVGVFTPHMDVHIDMALSLKVPEFVAMQVPVIAVRTAIMTSLFRDDEVLMFPDGDLESFADCLCRLYCEPGLAARLARRASRMLEVHSWEREVQGYFGLLERLTSRRVAAREVPRNRVGHDNEEPTLRTFEPSQGKFGAR